MQMLSGNKLSQNTPVNVSETDVSISNVPNIRIKKYNLLNGNQSLNITSFLSYPTGPS